MDATHSEVPAGSVNTALVAGLRELADWLEAHADADLPEFSGFVHASVYSNDARQVLERFARLLGDDASERVEYGSVRISGEFPGGVRLELSSPAKSVGGEKIERVEYEPIIAPTQVAA